MDGTMFGLPIVFDTSDESIVVGDKLLLTYQGQNIGTLTVDEKWQPNKPLECKKCYGTTSIEHPAVQMVSMERGKFYLGGKARPRPCICKHQPTPSGSLALSCFAPPPAVSGYLNRLLRVYGQTLLREETACQSQRPQACPSLLAALEYIVSTPACLRSARTTRTRAPRCHTTIG